MDKAEFAVKLLKCYAEEEHRSPKDLADISSLEEWLIIKMWLKAEHNKDYFEPLIEPPLSIMVMDTEINNEGF